MHEREMVDALVDLLDEMAYMADEDPEVEAPYELTNTRLVDAETGVDRVAPFEVGLAHVCGRRMPCGGSPWSLLWHRPVAPA